MIPNWMVPTILGLIVAAWFLIGEKKSFGEKVGTVLFFIAAYLFYKTLNADQVAAYGEKIKDLLGIH